MKGTDIQLKQAILDIADHLGGKKVYETMFTMNALHMPRIVENIVYDMFTNQVDASNCPEPLLHSYKMLHAYAYELSTKGFVKFEN